MRRDRGPDPARSPVPPAAGCRVRSIIVATGPMRARVRWKSAHTGSGDRASCVSMNVTYPGVDVRPGESVPRGCRYPAYEFIRIEMKVDAVDVDVVDVSSKQASARSASCARNSTRHLRGSIGDVAGYILQQEFATDSILNSRTLATRCANADSCAELASNRADSDHRRQSSTVSETHGGSTRRMRPFSARGNRIERSVEPIDSDTPCSTADTRRESDPGNIAAAPGTR